MSSNDLITRARSQLILSAPFFGILALRLKTIEDPNIETAGTDGAVIRYNPAYVNAMTLAKVTGLVAHETMHCACLHMTRKGSRDHRRWNIACDYAIDQILVDAGFDVPDALLNPDWRGMSAEEIYNLLPNYGPGEAPQGCGDVMDPPGQSQSEVAGMEAEWKIVLAQAAHTAKQAGKLPAGLERLIDDTLATQQNWRQELHQFCNTPIPADVTWNRPNRRFVHQGLYLPSRDTKMTGRFVVGIDTSGSIRQTELSLFGAEIKGIVDQLAPEEVIVIYCDAAVNRVDRFGPHDEVTLHAVGGGGTDFRPPFRWLEDNNIRPDAFVYLTDGQGLFPDEHDIEFPVLWAINNHHVVPPWGVHIIIDGD